jgi:hypothetical protein
LWVDSTRDNLLFLCISIFSILPNCLRSVTLSISVVIWRLE